MKRESDYLRVEVAESRKYKSGTEEIITDIKTKAK